MIYFNKGKSVFYDCTNVEDKKHSTKVITVVPQNIIWKLKDWQQYPPVVSVITRMFLKGRRLLHYFGFCSFFVKRNKTTKQKI